MQVAAKAHHSDNHTQGSRVGRGRTGVDQMASLQTAVDKHSARVPEVQPKLAHGRSQQTCVVDARQHTIASGSCCCSSLGGSRSCLDCRTESSDAIVHAKAGRRDSGKARSAPGTVS
jgi:hypothetical protein